MDGETFCLVAPAAFRAGRDPVLLPGSGGTGGTAGNTSETLRSANHGDHSACDYAQVIDALM